MMAIFRKEMFEIIRTRKLAILFIVFLFIAISSPILAKLMPTIFNNIPSTSGITFNLPEPTYRDALDQFVKNIAQIGVIVLVFVFAGVISDEKSKKTLEIILTKPISRASYILSKFFAAFLSIGAIYIVCALIFYLYSVSLFGHFSFANFSLMGALALVYIFFITGIAILCSTFSNSNIVAAFVAFGIDISIVSILSLIGRIAKYIPGQIIGNYRDFFTGIGLWDYLPSALISIGIIMLCMVFSIIIFRKQEIEK